MKTCTIFTNIVLFVFISHVKCTTNVGTFFTGTANKRVPSSFMETTSASAISCCLECDLVDLCKSVSYHTSNTTCLLSAEPRITVNVYGQTSPDWITYSKEEDWMLVFRGTPGAGGDILHTWYNGTSVTTHDVTCMTTNVTSCSKHYRHPIVDSWSDIGVFEVKVVYYKDNNEGAFVVFNAIGSDVSNWFSSARVLDSSWTSLKSESFERFSMEGHAPSRRLFILRDYNDCPGDIGYTVTITDSTAFTCDFDKQDNYPQFLYSPTDRYGYINSDFVAADVFAIFIK